MYNVFKKMRFVDDVKKSGIKWSDWKEEYDEDCDQFVITIKVPNIVAWRANVRKAESLKKEWGDALSISSCEYFWEVTLTLDFDVDDD